MSADDTGLQSPTATTAEKGMPASRIVAATAHPPNISAAGMEQAALGGSWARAVWRDAEYAMAERTSSGQASATIQTSPVRAVSTRMV